MAFDTDFILPTCPVCGAVRGERCSGSALLTPAGRHQEREDLVWNQPEIVLREFELEMREMGVPDNDREERLVVISRLLEMGKESLHLEGDWRGLNLMDDFPG